MSQSVLSQLLRHVADLPEDVRLQVLDAVRAGHVAQALACLDTPTVGADRTSKAWGALQLYLLHLNGEYVQANRVLDGMIGMNLSEQLTIENCPTQAEIMARWTRPHEEAISIVCTTFNHERFIGMALASFFSQQTTHMFEVVVRDDASTDGTVEIVRRWQQRYPHILRLEALSHNTYSQGVSAGRAALDLTRYPLVAFCEGDDFWVESDKLERQALYLVDNPSWSAVTHNHFELSEAAGQLSVGRPMRARGFLDKQDLLQVNLVLWLHTLLVRKSRFQLPDFNTQAGILGDQVLTAMLGAGGPVFYLGDCVASVARRNLASTYTPLSAHGKQSKRIRTKIFIAEELERIGQARSAARLRAWCERAEAAMKAAELVGN